MRMFSSVALVAAAVILQGCSSSGTPPASTRSTRPALVHVPPRADALCAKAARAATIPVLCPSVLPRATRRLRPQDPLPSLRVASFPSSHGRAFHLIYAYGAPSPDPTHNRPDRFLHFDVLGYASGGTAAQDFTAALLDPSRKQGNRPFLRRLRPITIAGHRGVLYAGLPFTQAGDELGGHLTFIWHESGRVLATSLHASDSRPATLRLLEALTTTLSTPGG